MRHDLRFSVFDNRRIDTMKGQALFEYALLIVLVAVIVMVVLVLVGPAIGNMFSNVVANI